jgi:hypothetical protein
MANDYHRLKSRLLQLRGQSSRIIAPEDMAGRILNMELTETGTLRSVVGPVEYHPATYNDNGGSVPSAVSYGAPHHGLFHCKLQGGKRDILLAHFVFAGGNASICAHRGQSLLWNRIIGPTASADYQTALPENGDRPNFLTQFEATPNGVVIVPQGGRAYFYDGTTVAPLGFDATPAPPTPLGPRNGKVWTATVRGDIANLVGYVHSGQVDTETLGNNRLGSIANTLYDVTETGRKSNPLGGALLEGEWRAAVQFVDHWGNLSPISGQSAPAQCHTQTNTSKLAGTEDELAAAMKIQILWGDLDIGPPHTIARNLYRTRDLKNSGIPGLFWVSPNAASDPSTFATLHDNSCPIYPDNTPDTWLVARPFVDPDPVPTFRLCKQAFGRMWIANTLTQPGMLRPSEPGKWGTFPKGEEIFPDAGGAAITGLWTAGQGLLVFTETSTFLVTEGDNGTNAALGGFRAATLHPLVGCVSPDSIATLPNGLTVWLGREGFYGFDGEKVVLLSSDIKADIISRINNTRRLRACAAVDPKMGEYRCWVPVDGSTTNNLCVIYDGQSWRERTDVKAAAVCTTRDHRQYMLALGTVDTGTDHPSVWVLDHEAKSTKTPAARDSIVETHWLRNTRAHRRASPMRVSVWFRETTSGQATVEVMRDWRESPTVSASGPAPNLYTTEDPPPFWDTAAYGSSSYNALTESTQATGWVNRRPYWSKIDVHVPSCEVFRVRIKYQGDMEFVGISYEEADKHAGGFKLDAGGEV